MLRIKLGINRLLQEKLFSAINIIGLGVGIACFVLIGLYLQAELGFESHFSKADRIYRIATTVKPTDGSEAIELATNAPPMGPLVLQDIAEVEAYARLAPWNPAVIVGNGEPLYVSTLLADASVVELFDFVWLAGDSATALQEPGAVVLTASAAQRLFATVDVMGRTFTVAEEQLVKVTGVLADPPATTQFQFEMLAPMALAAQAYNPGVLDSWYTQVFHLYILLQPGASIDVVHPQLSGVIARHLDQEAAGVFEQQALPLRDLHLHSNRRSELGTPGSIQVVSAAAAIAVVVLLMACVNFINLSTAKAAQRAREIGVYKSLGADKTQLVLQLLGEALLMTVLAAVVAVALVELSLPVFNAFMHTQVVLDLLNPLVSGTLVLLVLLVTLVAGLYPAFYLTAKRPSDALRGVSKSGKQGAWLRNTLVVVQFSAAITLLACTITLYQQVVFMQAQDLGYQRENVVVLGNLGREGVGRQWDAMKQQLLALAGVEQAVAVQQVPTQAVFRNYFISYEDGAERRNMPTVLTEPGYMETLGIALVAGQGWQQGQASFVISTEAARLMGWSPQQALGKWIDPMCCGLQRAVISGVVQDVHYGSLRTVGSGAVLYAIPPEPLGAINSETRLGLGQIAIKVSTDDLPAALNAIDRVWQQFHPNQPITRSVLDEQVNALYQEEERQGRMLTVFSILALLITCLGLYGLATYNTLRRTKEIGVRKVMGGSVWSIVWLLTNDFSKLVLVSNLIAWPLAYVVMERWLENFAYRIDLTPLVFIGSGLIALCIAWVTVGGTAAKAASTKPVLALRYE